MRRRPIVASLVHKYSGYCVGSSRSEFVDTPSPVAAAIADRAAAASAARAAVHSAASSPLAGDPHIQQFARASFDAAVENLRFSDTSRFKLTRLSGAM